MARPKKKVIQEKEEAPVQKSSEKLYKVCGTNINHNGTYYVKDSMIRATVLPEDVVTQYLAEGILEDE